MSNTDRRSKNGSRHAEHIQGHRIRRREVRGLEHLDGGYSVCFERHTPDADLTEVFRGLPDDRSPLPRWGYVIEGRIGFRFDDRLEVYETGDAYYVPPGHTVVHHSGTEIVEFSPTEVLGATIEVVAENLRRSGINLDTSDA